MRFLFAGPRGTGKTSIARIFAKALNCTGRKQKPTPCDVCESCKAVSAGRSLDLVEIDAASNRGIDEIRNLKESASVSAPSGGYKVFLVDEVHMLTKDAFNALLKILEEPPSHVVFVLATTEPHKILPTVLSRVQRFDLKRLTHKQIAGKLRDIAASEGVKVSDEGLMALAVSSDGALRDAEVALSKVLTVTVKNQEITLKHVNDALGFIPYQYYPKFLEYIASHDSAGSLRFLHEIQGAGIDMEHFTKEFLEYLRKVLIARIDPATLAAVGEDMVGEHAKILQTFAQQLDPKYVVKMITVFITARSEMKVSPIQQLPLELAIMELTQ